MTIKVYNTLSNEKEVFTPLKDCVVKIYSCGPTVYDYIHIGNARAFVVPDVIRNYLEYRGYNVVLVQNITDIDDKIIDRANEKNTDTQSIADTYIDAFMQDMEALGIRKPDYSPKATKHIKDIINLISALQEGGYTYQIGNSIYYDISKYSEYGRLSNQKLNELVTGARVEADDRKRNPGDFVLWKESKENEPSWDSPWGKGRPGWHIECSAMSMRYLGKSFDIHTGGIDLVFPHHENEIAQSQAVSGKPFVKYWIHNGYINMDGEKMSKSKGNILTIRELLKNYSPAAIRYFLISKHYRSPINYTDDEMKAATAAVERIRNTMNTLKEFMDEASDDAADKNSEPLRKSKLEERVIEAEEKFIVAMDDDFNTAAAFGGVFELIKHVNSFVNSQDYEEHISNRKVLSRAGALISNFCNILGIYYDKPSDEKTTNHLFHGIIDLVLDIRQDARANKNWPTADKIRDRLDELGIIIEDSSGGSRWRYKDEQSTN